MAGSHEAFFGEPALFSIVLTCITCANTMVLVGDYSSHARGRAEHDRDPQRVRSHCCAADFV